MWSAGVIWVSVALGGAAGSLLRFLLTGCFARTMPGAALPWGTLAANLSGSFLIGCLAAVFESLPEGQVAYLRPLLMAGCLGGFTTFSAYTLESLALLKAGEWHAALLYAGLSNALGIGLAAMGYLGSRSLFLIFRDAP